MSHIMIKVSPQIANSLNLKYKSDADELLQVISAYNARIGSPTGPVGEANLYFPIEIMDSHRCDDLINALAALPGVEAAYVKPADELP